MTAEARVEIIVEVNGTKYYLDTFGVESIPLVFNIQDIKDISVTKGSYSKSIVLPETKNNREVFNYISDLNSYSSFNPATKNHCWVLVDTELVIDGFFQLTNIKNDENKTSLSIVIYSDSNNFYSTLGEDFIDTLDLSRYNHTWSRTNIVSSWSGNYTHGYYYPLIDYGYDWTLSTINGSATSSTNPKGVVSVNQIFPAFYIRTIFDQIFTEAGFTWESNSLPDTVFNNLITPISNSTLSVQAVAGTTSAIKIGLNSSQNVVQADGFFYRVDQVCTTNWLGQTTCVNGTYTYGPGGSFLFFVGSQVETKSTVKFNKETSPYSDPSGSWNSTTGEYTNLTGANKTLRFGFNMNIHQLNYYADDKKPYLQLFRSKDPNTGVDVAGGVAINTCENQTSDPYEPDGLIVDESTGWVKGGFVLFGNLTFYNTYTKSWYSKELQLYPGEKVWLKYVYRMSGRGDYDTTDGSVYRVNGTHTVAKIMSDSYIYTEAAVNANQGDDLFMNSCIPKNVKRKDFVLSLIKMFNLIVEPSKTRTNHLTIETRDYYYANGEFKDWTNKINLNDPVEITPLGDQVNKIIEFKYKDDKDYYNADYKDRTGISYGELKYSTNNDFAEGKKTIEPIFSPTPLVALGYDNNPLSVTASSIIIPKIGVVNNGKFAYATNNIRILQRKYVTVQASSAWVFVSGTPLEQYPYAGHFDDPVYPHKDINFQQVRGFYYPQPLFTPDNLYTLYWKRMIAEMTDSDSRLVTCSVYLTPYDIANFKFSDNIYLDFGSGGQYYKVSKIDYDPTDISTAKVEFIKTKDITVPDPPPIPVDDTFIYSNPIISVNNTNGNRVFTPDNSVLGWNNTIKNPGNSIVGDNNNTTGTNISITGNENIVISDSVSIIGDDNIVAENSNYTLISGRDNFISQGSTNSTIFGNNNKVEMNTTGVVIIGNDTYVDTSNSINIGGKSLIVMPNYVDAGRDEVLSPFSDNWIVNKIDASTDAIRELGSYTNINIISAGRDIV